MKIRAHDFCLHFFYSYKIYFFSTIFLLIIILIITLNFENYFFPLAYILWITFIFLLLQKYKSLKLIFFVNNPEIIYDRLNVASTKFEFIFCRKFLEVN